MNVSHFMNLAAIFSLDLESQSIKTSLRLLYVLYVISVPNIPPGIFFSSPNRSMVCQCVETGNSRIVSHKDFSNFKSLQVKTWHILILMAPKIFLQGIIYMFVQL